MVPVERFSKRTVPKFSRPQEVACFSYDEKRRLFLDARGLKYYVPPNQAIPLSHGFESYVTRDLAKPEHLDALLASLHAEGLASREAPTPATRRTTASFVTWRGILTKLFSACFDRREQLVLRAVLFNGTIYLVEHELEARQERERNLAGKEAIWAYGGYKFEALSTVAVPPDQATPEMLAERETAIVNNNEQFCSVLKTRFGDHLIYIGAEVDCALDPPAEPGSTDTYVELKTNRVIGNERQHRAFGSKLMKIYLQSFLAGIPRVFVGFRDDDNIVREIREFDTMEIPEMTHGTVDWDANVCMAFGAAVLEFLKRTIKIDDPYVVHTVRLEADGARMTVVKEEPGPNAQTFLPEWFINAANPANV